MNIARAAGLLTRSVPVTARSFSKSIKAEALHTLNKMENRGEVVINSVDTLVIIKQTEIKVLSKSETQLIKDLIKSIKDKGEINDIK